jgi:hypothetical protein
LTTLKKLAAVYDVGLVVRFVPFSQLVNWETRTAYLERGFGSETFDVQTFEEEEENGALDESPKNISFSMLISIQGEANPGGEMTQLAPSPDESLRPAETIYKNAVGPAPNEMNQVIVGLEEVLRTSSGERRHTGKPQIQRRGQRRMKGYGRRKLAQRQAA